MKAAIHKLPKRALYLYIAAGLVFVGIIFVAQWHISGISQRNDIRDNGQKTTGMAESRTEVRFQSVKGEIVGKPLIGPQQGTLKKFDSVAVFYDKNNPSDFILDQNDSAYSATMWIAIAKLSAVCLLLLGLGFWYQRKAKKIGSATVSSKV